MSSKVNLTHGRIGRQIVEVERAVLAFHSGLVRSGGSVLAEDSNNAIILAARLSNVWRKLGEAIPCRRR